MRRDARRVAAAISGALTLAACGYATLALARTLVHRRTAPAFEGTVPFTSVLVPLYGDEPGLEGNLRAHCAHEGVPYEVLFGARDPADAGLAVARRVAAEFPQRARTIVADGPALRNPKVTTLVALAAHARGDVLVVTDSDVRLAPSDLRGIVAPFADATTGATTCLYRGAPVDHPVARFGAAGIEEQFAPSVYAALALEPLRYCFGAAMAVRRTTLERIGGFTAIGGHLADDFALGAAVSALGERVALARPIVATVVPERRLGALWSHERRWARTTFAVRPAGYVGALLTYPLPLALVHLACARSRRAVALAVVAFGLRTAIGAAARATLGSPRRPLTAWTLVARDMFGLAVWASAFVQRRVDWRGDRFTIGAARWRD